MAPAPEKKWTWVMAGMGAGIVFLMALLGLGVLIYRSRTATTTPPAGTKPAPSVPASQGTLNPPTSPGAVSNSNLTGAQNPGREAAGAATVVQWPPSKKPVANVTEASHPSGGTGKNAKKSARANGTTSAASQPTPTRVIQLFCRFALQDAILTVSNDTRVIFQGNLKGSKKGGLLHVAQGYEGTISQPLNIPAGTHKLLLHVRSADGTTNLTGTTSVAPSSNGPGILHVTVSKNSLNLYWAIPPHH